MFYYLSRGRLVTKQHSPYKGEAPGETPAPTIPLQKLYYYANNLHFSKDNKEVKNNTMVEKTSEFLSTENICLGRPLGNFIIKIFPSGDQVFGIFPSLRFSMTSFIVSFRYLVKFSLIKIRCPARLFAE